MGYTKIAKILQVSIFALTTCVVGGCSTNANQQVWTNPRIAPELRRQQFTLDSTECQARANQLIPEPAVTPSPQPQSGMVYLETPNGPVNGTYQTQLQPQQVSVVEAMQQVQGVQKRKQARLNYAFACMGDRGWQLVNRSDVVTEAPHPYLGYH